MSLRTPLSKFSGPEDIWTTLSFVESFVHRFGFVESTETEQKQEQTNISKSKQAKENTSKAQTKHWSNIFESQSSYESIVRIRNECHRNPPPARTVVPSEGRATFVAWAGSPRPIPDRARNWQKKEETFRARCWTVATATVLSRLQISILIIVRVKPVIQGENHQSTMNNQQSHETI